MWQIIPNFVQWIFHLKVGITNIIPFFLNTGEDFYIWVQEKPFFI